MPIPEMKGQKVLVTGAGAGIGRGLTKSLLEMGAEVGIRIGSSAYFYCLPGLGSIKDHGKPSISQGELHAQWQRHGNFVF